MSTQPTPFLTREFPLENLFHDHALAIAIEAAKRSNWELTSLTTQGFEARTIYSSFPNIKVSIAKTLKVTIENEEHYSTASETIEIYFSNFNKVKESISDAELTSKTEAVNTQIDRNSSEYPDTEGAMGKIKNIVGIFKPVSGYYITPILIMLNLLVFIVMIISGVNAFEPTTEDLVAWGADFKPLTLDGQWWRLITCTFIHIGVIHLALNLYALIYIGVMLEPLLGRTKFAAAYLLTGIVSSLVSTWWNSNSVSAGASGAVFGMYGLFLSLLTTSLIERTARNAFLKDTAVFIIYNLIYGLNGGVDNAAHIGGLLSGIAIGYMFYPLMNKQFEPKKHTILFGGICTAIIIACSIFYFLLPNDYNTYTKNLEKFSQQEQHSLSFYNLPENTANEKRLESVSSALSDWIENAKLVGEIETMDLPDYMLSRNKRMKDYVNARISYFTLYKKALTENTGSCNDSLVYYDQKISEIISDLNTNY